MLKIGKLFCILLLFPVVVKAQLVRYDEGAVYIKGLTLLQDANDPLKYYYLPRYPRLAKKDDGSYEFLCLKYKSDKVENSGGLFHALIEFSLEDSVLQFCNSELQKIVPGAKVAGQVPLREAKKDDKSDDDVQSSFEIVSAILTNKNGKDAMTRSVVSSGHAPFTPGSKAAVAALLNTAGSTLLWNSFTGPTTDVSIGINGYYEAMTRAYNATVTADMRIVYRHFSEMSSVQKNYDKTQIRRVLDTLMKKGTIKVEVADRSAGLDVKTSDMEGILSMITTKLTELMFDSKTGWSANPEIEDPNLGFNPKGRQGERTGAISEAIGAIGDMTADVMAAMPVVGWFSRKRNTNPKYITDNQYVLKDITKIRSNTFYLNLSKSVSIKVPYHTAGNLNTLFDRLGNDKNYFRIVNMDDPDFEDAKVVVQVDGEYTEAFDDIINFVTVNLRKKYPGGQSDVTKQLLINSKDLKKDVTLKEIIYPRLGIKTDWQNYEYQVMWSFRGLPNPVRIPANENQWLKGNQLGISLVPPLVKDVIELDADRQLFMSNGIASVSINFASVMAGERKVVRSVVLRADDKSSTSKIIIYHDKGSPVVYQPTWYSKENGTAVMDMQVLNGYYIFLLPPAADKFSK